MASSGWAFCVVADWFARRRRPLRNRGRHSPLNHGARAQRVENARSPDSPHGAGPPSRWATASAPPLRHPISWASAVAAMSATFTLAIALGTASATHISVAMTQITNATRAHGIQHFNPINEPCRPDGRAIPSPLWMIAQAHVTQDAQTLLT